MRIRIDEMLKSTQNMNVNSTSVQNVMKREVSEMKDCACVYFDHRYYLTIILQQEVNAG